VAHERPPERERVTPELALVSPELAERERALLPPPGTVRWGTYPPRPPAVSPKAAGARPKRRAGRLVPRVRRVPRRRRGLVLWVALGAAVVAAIVVVPLARRSPRAHLESVPPAPPGATTAPARALPPGASRRGGRVLAWPVVGRASYYDVQVYRGRRKVFEAWPVTARLVLPSSWVFRGRAYRLTRGIYTWYVWPGLGPRAAADYGALTRRAELTVR